MLHRFGDFELDEEARALRLRGEELPLQPLVLDFLIYLVRRTERVVPKDELLDALWPDVIVTEGSLQRVASLARSALRAGGLEGAIRTYPRQGYRFCGAASEVRAADDAACGALEGASPEELEAEGIAAQIDGERARAMALLERAVSGFASASRPRDAARVAARLARQHYEQMQLTETAGWIERGRRWIAGEPEGVEHALLELAAARHAAALQDLETARAGGERALEIARRQGDADVEAIALVDSAFTLLALGEERAALERLDEAGLELVAGGLGAETAGLVFCGLIWTASNRSDWQAAAEWTDRYERWCEQAGRAYFPGLCRLHRAEVMLVRGALGDALDEIKSTCDELGSAAPWMEGEAQRVAGEIHLARGEHDEAERAFLRAHELGWEPQPGRALLLAARGEPEAGLRALERTLAEDRSWSPLHRRAQLLASLVSIALAADRADRARAALAELEELVGDDAPPAITAAVARARGELALASGDAARAREHLRVALETYLVLRAPLEAAATRLRLADAYAAEGDADAAALEREVAEAALARCRGDAT